MASFSIVAIFEDDSVGTGPKEEGRDVERTDSFCWVVVGMTIGADEWEGVAWLPSGDFLRFWRNFMAFEDERNIKDARFLDLRFLKGVVSDP